MVEEVLDVQAPPDQIRRTGDRRTRRTASVWTGALIAALAALLVAVPRMDDRSSLPAPSKQSHHQQTRDLPPGIPSSWPADLPLPADTQPDHHTKLPVTGRAAVRAVAASKHRYVAVGAAKRRPGPPAAIWWSDDGWNWQQATVPTDPDGAPGTVVALGQRS